MLLITRYRKRGKSSEERSSTFAEANDQYALDEMSKGGTPYCLEIYALEYTEEPNQTPENR